MVGQKRPGKRLREDELESFFDDSVGRDGTYLRVHLQGDKSFTGKGWPWIQAGIRNVLGQDKVEKANVLRDGCLLLKTKTKVQTEKLMKVSTFLGDGCEVTKDPKLNVSRGTIHAYDLLELSEEEVVHWLSEFGVTNAKRFTRKVGGKVEGTPTLLLTFDRPSCPSKLELDYITYHVKRHVPNPLICYQCGKFGHPEVRCTNDAKCLRCGDGKHSGDCVEKCANCSQLGHSCLSRKCEVWQREKDICTLKVEKEIPYGQARKIYESAHQPPALQGYADVVRTPSINKQSDLEMKGNVERLEQKLDELTKILTRVAQQLRCEVKVTSDADEDKGESDVDDSQPEKDVSSRGDSGARHEESRKDTSSGKGTLKVTAFRPAKGKSKVRGKESRKHEMELVDDDEVASSQVLGRSTSLGRDSSRPGLATRQSWKDNT